MRIRSPRLAALLAVTALAVGTLASCAPEPSPLPPATSSASPDVAEPLFASDEEALAAAEAAYAAYQSASETVSSGGGGGFELLERYVSPTYWAEVQPLHSAFSTSGLHTEGSSSFDTVSLAQQNLTNGSRGLMQVYLCQDVSKFHVLDAAGVIQDSPTRSERLPLIVTFVGDDEPEGRLLIEGSDVWAGDDFC